MRRVGVGMGVELGVGVGLREISIIILPSNQIGTYAISAKRLKDILEEIQLFKQKREFFKQ